MAIWLRLNVSIRKQKVADSSRIKKQLGQDAALALQARKR